METNDTAEGRHDEAGRMRAVYKRYAFELLSEITHYLVRVFLTRGSDADVARGQLLIRLHQMIAAIEERPFNPKVLNAYNRDTQVNAGGASEASP